MLVSFFSLARRLTVNEGGSLPISIPIVISRRSRSAVTKSWQASKNSREMDHLLAVIVFLNLLVTLSSLQTGFWYDGTSRAPETQYDTVPYANLTVKVNQPYQSGPGQNLVNDPLDPQKSLYVGGTINRQTFDTQFILDMSKAIGIETRRIFVLYVTKGEVHYSWESTNVIVNFIFLERTANDSMTLLQAVANLTQQIQNPSSPLFKGNTHVTRDIDPLWGLQVINWDVSLKLTYAISVVGGSNVIDDYYLDQGSSGVCDLPAASNFTTYCEFERFFEDDISRALQISVYRVQILFIKSSSYDSVLVHFRIYPQKHGTTEADVSTAISDLISQVANISSPLYFGNVTIRTGISIYRQFSLHFNCYFVDPTWGVSENGVSPRKQAALFTRKYYEYDKSRIHNPLRSKMITAYDRCKANRRCNWGIQGIFIPSRLSTLTTIQIHF